MLKIYHPYAPATQQRIKSEAAENNLKGRWVVFCGNKIFAPDVIVEGVLATGGFFSLNYHEGQTIGIHSRIHSWIQVTNGLEY